MKTSHMKFAASSLRYAYLLALATIFAIPAVVTAQTNGNPLLLNGTAPAGSAASESYIDAYVATGGSSCSTQVPNCNDICERINYAWNAALGPLGNHITSAIVDARGFPQPTTWTCSQSPFQPINSTKVPTGQLLLGAYNIETSVTWYVPGQMEVRGMGAGGPAAVDNVNTIITNNGINNASGVPNAVIQMGPAIPALVFGVVIDNLAIDCQGQNPAPSYATCIGIVNDEAEEKSEVHHVAIWDAPLYGMHVSAYINNTPAFPAAANSGPYWDIAIAYSGCTGTNNSTNCEGAIGLLVDGAGSAFVTKGTDTQTNRRNIRQFEGFTISGDGVTNNIATGAMIYGVSTTFANNHIEFVNTGVQIGTSSTSCFGGVGDCETHGVTVSNTSIATTNSSGHAAVVVGNPNNAAPLTGDVTLIGIAGMSGLAYTLVDNVSNPSAQIKLNSALLPAASLWDPYIGMYAIGHCSTDTAGCTPTPPVKNTQ